MAEGMNVRITGKLRSYVEAQTGENGLYESVSEYVRALIRQDYERTEAIKWSFLHQELLPGMQASEEQFTEFSSDEIKTAGRQMKKRHAP